MVDYNVAKAKKYHALEKITGSIILRHQIFDFSGDSSSVAHLSTAVTVKA